MNEKEKHYVTEWSFSFETLHDRISDFVKSVGIKSEEQIKTAQFSEPVGSATSARVRIDLPVGKSTINPLVDSENLIEADLTYVGEVNFSVSGDTEKVVNLSHAHGSADWFRNFFGWIGSGQRLHWDISLTTQIPLDLEVHNGVGKCDFDLAALQVSALRVSGGTGEVNATLPAGQYNARVESGVGQSNITIPAGATVDLQMNAGTGEINLDIGDNAAVSGTIRGGVGAVNIQLPQNAAARIEYRAGLGGASVTSRLNRIGSSGEGWNQGGIWQSADYDSAERKITLKFDGGVGGLKVT